MERWICEDREAGHLPICIVGNVGTVNTGAVDPVDELVAIARKEKIWLHLDGAFGAFAYLVPSCRTFLGRIGEAHSLVFDLHKWFYLPFDVSCVLVRRANILEDTFGSNADYVSKSKKGPASYPMAFSDRSIEQSRRFRALKVWFAIKTHGVEAFARAIAGNIRQVEHLARRLDETPCLETVARGKLNIICFRHTWPGADLEKVNGLNRESSVAPADGGACGSVAHYPRREIRHSRCQQQSPHSDR